MKILFDEVKITRTLRRITHEILERHHGVEDLVIIGIKNSGIPLAEMIRANILKFEGEAVPFYHVDITGYRDDKRLKDFERFEVDLTGKQVILVDDVLYTGRTVRAAMDALMDAGRPAQVELAVLIDRGHRELPIRADYVGKSIPTHYAERVVVDMLDKKLVYIKEA